MPQNIELKARCPNLDRASLLASEIADRGPTILQQRDTYFACARGRLKLREHHGGRAELIAYDRENDPTTRASAYQIVDIAEPQQLKLALERCLGIDAVVTKRRELWWVGSIRIHLDSVDDIGRFIEFEAVLSDEYSDPIKAKEDVDQLAIRFGIMATDRIGESYRELSLRGSAFG